MRSTRPLVLLAACCVLSAPWATPARADDPKTEGKEAEAHKAEAPPTVAVEKGPFSVVLDLNGVFEPLDATDVAYEPKAYGGELEVVESAPSGPVEKGQTLVRFDTEKIDEALANADRELELARRNLARQQEETKRAQEGSDIAVIRAKEEKARADRVLANFLEKDREMRTRESELRIQGMKDNISDQQEELAQLEKMYKADDVVEGTEDIVMKRAKRQLERSQISYGFQQVRHKYMVEVELPEEQRAHELNARKEANELDRLMATVSIGLEQAKLEMAKAVAGFEKQTQALAKLKVDREALVVKAPRAGVAIPGSCVHGKWSGVDETTRALEKGGKLRAGQTIFTIVTPGAVAVRTGVTEAQLLSVRPGMVAEVVVNADPAKPLQGKVARVGRVPADGSYEVVIELADKDERLMPGFTSKIKLKTVEKAEALTVPEKSVVADGEKKLVQVLGEDGKPVSREVKTGATSGGRTEILEGLQAADRVLKTPAKP